MFRPQKTLKKQHYTNITLQYITIQYNTIQYTGPCSFVNTVVKIGPLNQETQEE